MGLIYNALNTKELIFCHKLFITNPYILATQRSTPLIL